MSAAQSERWEFSYTYIHHVSKWIHEKLYLSSLVFCLYLSSLVSFSFYSFRVIHVNLCKPRCKFVEILGKISSNFLSCLPRLAQVIVLFS